MAQVSMTVRMDAGLKASFDALCSQMGMSANKAMNSLAQYFVITRTMPAEVQLSSKSAQRRGEEAFNALWAMAEAGELPDLSMDEIKRRDKIIQGREMKVYAVIDTNVLLSAILSKKEDSATRRVARAMSFSLTLRI